MAETAAPTPHPRLELPLAEARARFVQLARLAGLTRQTTVVTDGGRPLAAIVPVTGAVAERSDGAAAGWIRRIEKLRAELRRQHVGLERALEQAWRELDRLSPPGADARLDALRTAHADVRARAPGPE
ncbi:type II toxin-antitoxin system Phd/YefM family antitoxin [Actinoplanes sp. NPDC049668]|uniref:type II toxin-antitoxin system Phd/YefM family antitoxin n=1 Tax=unclassified Actinoplanes TaxID=2626549 RepID=UPI0033A6A3D7